MTSSEGVLGLFPLGLVLLPGELLPLHVFEERYKRLIGESRRTGEVFGIVLRHEDSVAECGCTAEVTEVLEEFDDGRLNIVVRGRDRFRLHELLDPDDEDDYLRARVTYFEDDDPDAPARMTQRAETLYRRLLEVADVEPAAGAGEGAEASFRMAGTIDFGLSIKQQLLESLSESERLEQLIGLMSSLVPRLELRKEREEAIRGNGKGY
jgi:ATP-dependent Lon protease